MAFFVSALSSSIGKRLLLFGLRHIDILDKDPADFIDVDVGKKTTLRVTDVGLNVKKLVALLHIKLPPEVQLSKARASLFSVTFVLGKLGVPQIIIEIDGIQVHAKLTEDTRDSDSKSRSSERSSPRARSPPLRRSTSPYPDEDDQSEVSEEEEEGEEAHIPTVDDLAQSFIREEPEAEIRELEQELETQSAYLQDSVSSSDDGEDEDASGMGAPLGVPMYFRNILNTALDRLQILAKDIDIEVQDHFLPESGTAMKEEDPFVSLNFHVDRIAVDSVTSETPRVDVSASTVLEEQSSKSGKRRLRIDNICGRLISDADNFAFMSQVTRPTSPADTRSEVSSSQKNQNEQSASDIFVAPDISRQTDDMSTSPQTSIRGLPTSVGSQPKTDSPPLHKSQLSSSIHTTDDDRFADVASDDGLDKSVMSESSVSLPPPQMNASSILYDDEGILDYAIQNELLTSKFDESHHTSGEGVHRLGQEGDTFDATSRHEGADPLYRGAASSSGLPSASVLEQHSASLRKDHSDTNSKILDQPFGSTDNLDHARHQFDDALSPEQSPEIESPNRNSRSDELSESKIFSHDDAESMYMSAMSAAPKEPDSHHNVPGGWETSSSASSHDTASDTSAPIAEAMVGGSILVPLTEGDDGCETPRPSSPLSAFSSPREARRAPGSRSYSDGLRQPRARLAKLFLTINEVTVWFPLGINEDRPPNTTGESEAETSVLDFKPPHLPEDSMFQGMPGSFSNYAHSTSSRRKASVEEAARRRPNLSPPQTERPSSIPNKKSSASVSVEVGNVISHIDFSTGRIMFQMLQRTLKAFTGEANSKDEQPKSQEAAPQSDTRFSAELSVKHVVVAWRERLLAESIMESSACNTVLDANPLDAILKIRLSVIHAASQVAAGDGRAKLQIGKFALSSLDHDIVTFQSSRPRSRRSIGNSPELLNSDVEIDYEHAKDSRITIVTRPVKLLFDVQKLDEALSSFGGFSGVLELSNSFASNTTLNTPVATPAPSRPRGVHFGDSPPAAAPRSPSTMPKVQIQLGEVSFVLKGKSCAVQLQTTSVRAAIRESNVRLKVSEVQLSGPYVDTSQKGAPLIVEIRNSTVNFLFVPEEVDLTRLISMIAPSKDPYENNDEIIMQTLLRQREKGSVLRAEAASLDVRISDLEQLKAFEALGAELARLSKVAKYLPDDDRPGILTLAIVQKVDVSTAINERLGDISVSCNDASIAHVGVPSLFAAEIGKASVRRSDEVLLHEVVRLRPQDQLPMIMLRIVGDEMEPVIKAKLFNVCAEYRVSTVMAALGIAEDGTVDQIALGLASSVATITGASSPKTLSRQSSATSSPPATSPKPLHVDVLLRDCALGLNPRKIPAKGLFVLSNAHFLGKQSKTDYAIDVELRKASLHAIDDVGRLEEKQEPIAPSSRSSSSDHHQSELLELGYVSLSSISAAKATVNISTDEKVKQQLVDVEFKNKLFVLESCADSTQTLIAILNGLQPPTPPSTAERYRTMVPLQEMMESVTEEAFIAPNSTEEENFMENADLVADEVPTNLEFVGSFYNQGSLPTEEELGDSMLGEDDLGVLATSPVTRQRGDRGLLESFQEQYEVAEGEEEFNFDEEYFKDSDISEKKGKARKWDSTKNQYQLTNEFKEPNAPLKVNIRDMDIHWHLFDGYDWPRTRAVIAQAVEDVETRAEERRHRPQEDDDEDDFVEEDFLFNSVWIGVPVKDEKGALAKRINQVIEGDDLTSETGSYATSTATRSTGATARPRKKSSKGRLKLQRSRSKKVSFDLNGVEVDFVVFPPDTGETINSVDVRVRDFMIHDHMGSSAWNKFVTCLIEPSQREMDRPMINLEILTVKPVTELAASELVIKVTILPLLLHVDQDALDFITRFFEFKDESALDTPAASEQPFIQRIEVKEVKLKLHYKPRRVDYKALRAGRTTEFMNFLILEDSDIILKRAILYGIPDFDTLHKTLNDVWMPDVKRNQLPGVLAGLAAVRPVVNVGLAFTDLVKVPYREYRKDGRIVRSLQKGALVFGRNTASAGARLGAKIAIGVQTGLEAAEKFLSPEQVSPSRASSSAHHHDWDGEDPSSSDSEEPRAVSNYANQPIGVRAGLQSAARHLKRDLLTARETVIAIPAEIMDEGTGMGAARVIAKRASTAIILPPLGMSKATAKMLQGVGNALDPQSRRRLEDKYKSY